MNSSWDDDRCPVPLSLSWTCAGASYRITAWPDVQVEQRSWDEWLPVAASEARIRAAAHDIPASKWQSFLEFVPPAARDFAGLFRSNRIQALQVAARCPDLAGTLGDTPALLPFVAAHATLRGASVARWGELNGVFERGGVFGVLEWLGLPASRQALLILRNLIAPDLPPELLAPIRSILWKPEGVIALAQRNVITDQDLAEALHALAA